MAGEESIREAPCSRQGVSLERAVAEVWMVSALRVCQSRAESDLGFRDAGVM